MFALDHLPDITFFFDVTPDIALARIKNNHREENRLDLERMEFHQKVYEGYCKLLEIYPDRIKRINANQPKEEVFKAVLEKVEKLL